MAEKISKDERRANRNARKVERSKLKGDKERAALGLDENITVQEPKGGGKNNMIFIIIAAVVVVAVVIFIIIKKRRK